LLRRSCCALLKSLRERLEQDRQWWWVLADEPLVHTDPEHIRFGAFSGSTNATCGCGKAVTAGSTRKKEKKKTTKRAFKRIK
jgi:hypothetical protein